MTTIFLNNKYKKIYDALINKRVNIEILDKNTVYCEKHHIIPRSLGGDDSKQNLVYLTLREHFIAHLLLSKFTTGDAQVKMMWACHRMAFSSMKNFTSKNYEWYRIRHSKWLSDNHHSKRIPEWANKMSIIVRKSWEEDNSRREITSNRMSLTAKQYHIKAKQNDSDYYYAEQRRKSLLSKEKRAQNLNYRGVNYKGYNELFSMTGITIDMYKKYCIYGFDPGFRINKNGPMTSEDINILIDTFIYKNDFLNKKEILIFMVKNNIITQKQHDNYLRKEPQCAGE